MEKSLQESKRLRTRRRQSAFLAFALMTSPKAASRAADPAIQNTRQDANDVFLKAGSGSYNFSATDHPDN